MQLNSLVQMLFCLLLALHVTKIYSYSLLANSSMVEVNKFLESYFTRSNSTTMQEWEANLPLQEEKDEMKKLLSFIYQLETFDNLHDNLMDGYTYLRNSVTVSVVRAPVSSYWDSSVPPSLGLANPLRGIFCVIHELIPNNTHRFPRMWGYTVIASKMWSQRPIHHSAAHFESDGEVCHQAAALLESTRSRSLVVAGASRYAVVGDHPSDCQSQFQLADAAHNCRTMFHWVNTVMKDLADEEVQKEGKENGHFFVQWHGNG
ncbi:hypothetical protein KIN20_002018 [Parelaphostrongylus tenuis]|uniref:Uncharacterized protein n=1 Tax=Parelaphostrongylus tenuis TaxID=148309 RepID=A0AAD5QGI5_PARTN|nr:hypothetical protein KIN20_002018 [Parelaphostrongylus tenuis]